MHSRNVLLRSTIFPLGQLDRNVALAIEHALISEFHHCRLLNRNGYRKPPLPAAVEFVRRHRPMWAVPPVYRIHVSADAWVAARSTTLLHGKQRAASGGYYLWVDNSTLDQLKAIGGPGGYSDALKRLVEFLRLAETVVAA